MADDRCPVCHGPEGHHGLITMRSQGRESSYVPCPLRPKVQYSPEDFNVMFVPAEDRPRWPHLMVWAAVFFALGVVAWNVMHP